LSSVQSAPFLAAATSSKERTESRERRKWLEILGITACVPLAIYCFHSRDPFLLRGGFPWLVLIPLLIGAQHGILAAVASSALLSLAAWSLGGHSAPEAIGAWSGGCLAAGVISGHFRDRICARLAHLSQQVEDDGARLVRLTRAHAVLKLSHQRLEERVSAQSWSLAAAVTDAKQRLVTCDSLASAGNVALNVFFNHAMVQSASLLLGPITGHPTNDALALELQGQLGPKRSVDVRHPLIERALASGRLVAIDVHADSGADSSILAVVPLRAASGAALGVLAVHEMPFMAFQAGHLKNLAVLALHLTDLIFDRDLPANAQPLELPAAAAAPGNHPAPAVPRPRAKRGDEAPTADTEFTGTRTGTRVRQPVARSA